jgi:tetratricopeptide (TPR) repeat protein
MTITLLAACMISGCKKDFLDKKPNKSLLVPATSADLRALLDNTGVFNVTPGLTFLADGELRATDAGWNAYPNLQERNSYTWSADIFGTETSFDWDTQYQQVFYTNVVLEELDKLEKNSENQQLRGEALFDRAYAFLNLAQMFAAPYRAASAVTDPGIPLRLTPVVTEKAGRGTVAEVYARMIGDLKAAAQVLPMKVSYKSRPCKAAVYGLLARVYLSMEDYPAAGRYADSCLQLRPELLNYNTLTITAPRPFPSALPNGGTEVIYYSVAGTYRYVSSSSPTYISTELYNLYDTTDLRKSLFFRQAAPGDFKFKGSYGGSLTFFSGLAADEFYLIRAECAARSGDRDAALSDLNALLVNRSVTGAFVPLTASDAEGALRLVLLERRKELTQRGIYWTDLRRLNHDLRFAVTLSRMVAGQSYTLAPDSKRYTYPIAQDELLLNPMPQNDR